MMKKCMLSSLRPAPAIPLLLTAFLVISMSAFTEDRRGLELAAKDLGGDYAQIGRQIAVLVAVDRYSEWLPLKNPVKDARAIKGILARRYWIDGFEELYDEDATKAGILRLFERLVTTTKAEDSVFIYYAGHGQLDQVSETGFWIPVDAGTDRYEQRNWIPNSQIRNLIGKMKARHVALASDACFSGDILNPNRAASPEITDAYFRNAYTRVSRQVLTSGASETVPDDSPFSRQLELALEGNQRPYLDPLMIFSEVRLGVTGTTPLFGSLRDSGHQDGGSFLFFLKKEALPAAVVAAKAEPSAGDAELMVSVEGAEGFGEEGAEIFVDGELVGKAPVLVQKLSAGKTIVVEARSGSNSGKVELTLASRELREIVVPLAPMKGNIFIKASEKDLVLFLDGEDRGPLGAGLLRDTPAGEHRLELVGADLYWSASTMVKGEETARLEAKMTGTGRLSVDAPDDVSVTIRSGGRDVASVRGGKVVDRLAVGDYELIASGPGYDEERGFASVERGVLASWRPYSRGRIEFAVEPKSATWEAIGLGPGAGYALDRLDEVFPGSYEVTLRAPGFRETKLSVSIAAGKTAKLQASLERLAPASIAIRNIPIGVGLGLGGALDRTVITQGKKAGDAEIAFDNLLAGVPFYILVSSVDCVGLDSALLPESIILEEGERRVLDFPVGSFSLPWAPEGVSFSLAPRAKSGQTLKLPMESTGTELRSPSLAPGSYRLIVDGRYPASLEFRIEAGKDVELVGYREALSTGIGSARAAASAKLKARMSRGTAGWVSLGAGVLGSAAAVGSYILGSRAYADYDVAETSADLGDARSRVELWGAVLPAATALGAVGLGLVPILWAGPKKSVLEDAIRKLDDELVKLGN